MAFTGLNSLLVLPALIREKWSSYSLRSHGSVVLVMHQVGLIFGLGFIWTLNLSLVKMRCLSLGRKGVYLKLSSNEAAPWVLSTENGTQSFLLKYVFERSATQYFKEAHKWAHLLQRQKFTLLNILTCLLYILFKEISYKPMYLLL